MKKLFRKINLFYKLKWLDILWSPFVAPKVKFYFGKIKHGTPYFLPRYTVKNKSERGYYTFKPAKWFKFDVVGLGWKDKWNSPRAEWSPLISLVILNRQFVVTFIHDDRIWESYLTYKYYTNKDTSTIERLSESRSLNGNVWISHCDGVEDRTDYFLLSLKKKYRKQF